KPPAWALLQSVLLQKLSRPQSCAADQPIQLDARQSHGQNTVALLIVLFALHRAQVEKLRTQTRQGLRQTQGANKQVIAEQFSNRLAQQLETTAVARRQPDPLRLAFGIALDLRLDPVKQVDLVVDLKNRQLIGANFTQYGHDLLDLCVAFRLEGVDHVQQQIRVAGLFQRGPKGLNQLVRQMANETHRIRENHRTDIVQLQPTQGWVQRGEQLVGGVHVGCGQRIEQR